jgi:hypothetical protein
MILRQRVPGSSRPSIIWVLFQEQHIGNDHRKEYSYLYNQTVEKNGFQFWRSPDSLENIKCKFSGDNFH